MRKLALFVGYGLLPLWASIVIVIAGSLGSSSSEYWAVAPWLIVVSIPLSAATLAIAAVTIAVQAGASGAQARKNATAMKVFWALNIALVAIAGLWWLQSMFSKRELESEKKMAADFVRNNDLVISRYGRDAEVVPFSTYTMGSNALPTRYEFAVSVKRQRNAGSPTQYGYAFVGAKGSSGQRQFALDCISTLSPGKRDPFKDPCKQ